MTPVVQARTRYRALWRTVRQEVCWCRELDDSFCGCGYGWLWLDVEAAALALDMAEAERLAGRRPRIATREFPCG